MRSVKYDNVLQLIGNTPLVRLNKIVEGFECSVWAKCEFFNPGGSIKDRIALAMIEKLEKQNKIQPQFVVVEPTSGNTGIGLALVGAVKGYKVLITMPEKMSKEKEVVLRCLGAEIIRTKTEEASESDESHIGIAKKLQIHSEECVIPDQYSNQANPDIHYHTTAAEILNDLDYKVDMLVASPGTGGTLTGLAKRFKEVNPNCIVVGADPIGSILGGGTTIQPYLVEGIGYDFFPKVYDASLVDYWLKVRDEDCFLTARKIIRLEGLLVGGSSGANMFAALKYLHLLKPGQNCVVIFPDGIRNYLSKFASDEWMLNNGFSSENRALNEPIVNYVKFLKPVPTIDVWENIREFIECDSPIALVLLGTKPFGILRKRTILRKMLVAENIHELAVFHCDKNFNLVEKSTTLRDIISIPDLSSLIIRITSDFKEESSEMTERFYTIDEQSILKILRNAKSQ